MVLVAAGLGTRLGADKPKAFVTLAEKTLIEHALENIAQVQSLEQVIIAVPSGHEEQTAKLADIALSGLDVRFDVVIGGETRQQSIANALGVLDQDVAVVLVHDAARPLVPIKVAQDVVAAIRNGAKAVIPVLPLVDTIKRVNNQGIAIETVDRNQLRRVQTPQGFDRATLDLAHEDPAVVATDDAGLMDALGIVVETVAGDERAIKITTMADVRYALSFLEDSHE